MTKIEWTEKTWNPLVGCSIVSPGCANCYAMKMASRCAAMGISRYDGLTKIVNGNVVWTGKLARAPKETLLKPLQYRKPVMYFVNSMSDLFHEDCPDEWIDQVFAVMALCQQHTFQVLTKRSDRMRKYMTKDWTYESIYNAMGQFGEADHADPHPYRAAFPNGMPWPLSNVWLGVSTERQIEANERIPDLLATPAAVRFISAEPLLGPIELLDADDYAFGTLTIRLPKRAPDIHPPINEQSSMGHVIASLGGSVERSNRGIDWVIVGGESGHGHRYMKPEWAADLIAQCRLAGIPVFMKQMSGKKPIPPELMIRQFPRSYK